MGSGRTHCNACGKRHDRCACLPERVEAAIPTCPRCGEEHEAAENQEYTRVPCSCGWTFEAERKVVFISRAFP